MKWNDYREHWSHPELSQFIKVRPHNWHIQDSGEENLPSILLIHGTGASTHSWRLLIPILRKKFRVVAVDLPGHGFTTLGSSNRSGLDFIAQDLASLLEDQKISPSLVIGHSAGAAIAIRYNMDYRRDLMGIISLNGVFDQYFDGITSFIYPFFAKLLSINPLTGAMIAKFNKSTRQIKRLSEITGSKIDSKSLFFYEELFSNPQHLTGTLTMMSQWKLTKLLNDLSSLNTNILLLAGENDKMVTPKVQKDYHHKLKNSSLMTLESLGHLMHEEAPILISEHIFSFYKKLIHS